MTPPIVVDASVAIKWYIPEEHSDRALWLRRYTYKRSVYDALYIALAGARDSRCITADATLVRALRRTPAGTSLWFLGDLRESELV